jgi:hypothetical protein
MQSSGVVLATGYLATACLAARGALTPFVWLCLL